MKITMNKKELINLLKEEYDKRLDVFSNLEEVTVEYEGNVILGADLKLKSVSGDLYTVVDGEVILNDSGKKCLKLKREQDDILKSKSVNESEDNPRTTSNIHKRKNKDKVSVKIDIDKPDTLEGTELGDGIYLVPFEDIKTMFTL
tara:strand:- start:635 stop:1069 length:435 start_codon:yes stop_codon:yes gene_type:complete